MIKMTDLKKGTWSVEEDEKLISYINKYGIWNWSQMPRFAGLSRSGKSCRLRWMNYLKPNVKRGKFSKEETEILLHLHSLLGNRWSAIASRLPGRTDNDVKNYWHTHLKKHVGEQNQVCKTTEQQNDITISPTFDAGYVENIQPQPANHMNAAFESQLVTNDYDYSSISSFSNTASNNYPFECTDNYVNTGSPGTIDDFQGFWDQLGPLETLEPVNNNQLDVLSDYAFQDIYNDPRSSYSFYNNNNNI